jgi:hypothetical protein
MQDSECDKQFPHRIFCRKPNPHRRHPHP